MKPNDPAFPIKESEVYRENESGIDVRTYLAAKAMQGFVANQDLIACGLFKNIQSVAETSVKYADALIAELNKEPAKSS